MKYAIEMMDGSIQIMTVFPKKMVEKKYDENNVLISEKEIMVTPDPHDEIKKWHETMRSQVKKVRVALENEKSSHRQE